MLTSPASGGGAGRRARLAYDITANLARTGLMDMTRFSDRAARDQRLRLG